MLLELLFVENCAKSLADWRANADCRLELKNNRPAERSVGKITDETRVGGTHNNLVEFGTVRNRIDLNEGVGVRLGCANDMVPAGDGDPRAVLARDCEACLIRTLHGDMGDGAIWASMDPLKLTGLVK